MAVVMRKSVINLLGFNNTGRALLAACKIRKCQAATLVLKQYRDFEHPPPYPYKEKEYGFWDSMFDKTSWRFNENSKLIIVDGAIACGKTKLAKEVAEAFDLHYICDANLDEYYVNDYGFDMRQLNDKLPFRCRSFDIHDFVANPYDERVCIMHHLLYQIRMGSYVDALNHILNTGQGVVLDRSIYCDDIFVDTFVKFGFYPENFRTYMNLIKAALMPELMKPHLFIYLDSPVDVTLQRIKERNYPGEKDSPVYKPEILEFMNSAYKKLLQEVEKNSEILVYDWSVERNAEVVIEDLEEVELDDYPVTDPKMEDWRKEGEHDWNSARMWYSQGRNEHFVHWCSNIPYLYCPEVIRTGEENIVRNKVWHSAPGMEYATGFNVKMGDPSWLLKV